MRQRRDSVLVYLADLTHTGLQVATESFPLNIGLVAAYAKKYLGEAVDLRLFKYPDRLAAALSEEVPDIIGCSNYVWNSNLAEWLLSYAKKLAPEVITVQGGTNYPFTAEGQLEFLAQHPSTDIYVFYEGELSFLNVLNRFLEARSPALMRTQPIAGCQFLSPDDGALVAGPTVHRLKSLDDVPSPYTTGLLDEFFDGQLTPMVETTRGCPFTCNFCNAGERYFTKVSMFSLDYVREELAYIAPRISAVGVRHLTIADNNFGMYPRDAEICRLIRDVQQKYGWPLGILSTTGKNNKQRILDATEILGRSLLVSMSVQSMDRDVLRNIKRDNINLDTYKQINEVLVQQGRSGMAELIFALPGETCETFMDGVRACIEAGAAKITSYTLQLLYGTDYKDPAYREAHGYIGKWRLIPLDYGEYEGNKIFDVEEVAVASKCATFDDYLLVRGFALLTECMYNNYLFREILRYLREHDVAAYDWLRAVWDRQAEFPPEVSRIFDSFTAETRSELFNSEAELRDFYSSPENYARLKQGEIGGNVIFKHKVRLMAGPMDDWVDFVTDVTVDLVAERTTSPRSAVRDHLGEIARYLKHRLRGVFDPASETTIVGTFNYDIPSWTTTAASEPLKAFAVPGKTAFRFFFTEHQLLERADSFARYGTDLHGLAKILARVPSHERLFRQVEILKCPASAQSERRPPACSECE